MEILKSCAQALKKRNVDQFEIAFEESKQLSIEIKEGQVDYLCESKDVGLSIRLLKDQRVGFAYTFDLSPAGLAHAVQTALDISELLPVDPFASLQNFSAFTYPHFDLLDEKGLHQGITAKIEQARALEAATLKHDARIKRIRQAGYDQADLHIALMDSYGHLIETRKSIFSCHVLCVAEEKDSGETGYESHSTHFLDQLEWESVGKLSAANAVELLCATDAPTMACPVVFKNSVTTQFLDFFSGSFSAENIDKNFSLLVGKKGQKVFSECIDIIDNGLHQNGIGTFPFDADGTPQQKTPLVESGMLSNYLYDNYYAKKHNTKSTGNSKRSSIKTQPSISFSNLYLKPGNKNLEQIISNVSTGIFITDLLGLHTANPITGDFSVGASGILIEKGKLTRPVKGFAIAGNLLDVFNQVNEVGSDLKFWGSLGAPSLAIAQLSIGGKSA